MVRTSGIREKLRSKVLQELAKERTKKAPNDGKVNTKDRSDSESDSDDDVDRLEQERRIKRAKQTNNSLLSVLPKPKNSSSFGPTVRLDKLLKMPERADDHLVNPGERSESPTDRLADDGMVEVDVSKVISDAAPSTIKELTMEKTDAESIIVPKGKEKQKNQITYLAQLGKANELKQKEQAAQGRINRAAARSKYGW